MQPEKVRVQAGRAVSKQFLKVLGKFQATSRKAMPEGLRFLQFFPLKTVVFAFLVV